MYSFLEPILGDGGEYRATKRFWSHLLTLAQKYQIVSIADETQRVWAGLEKWWAIEHFNVSSRHGCYGKRTRGGYVLISACVGRTEILDSLSRARHILLFLAIHQAVLLPPKIISVIEERKVLSKTERKGKFLRGRLDPAYTRRA